MRCPPGEVGRRVRRFPAKAEANVVRFNVAPRLGKGIDTSDSIQANGSEYDDHPRQRYPCGVFAGQLTLSALVWAGTVYALVRSRETILFRMRKASSGRRTLFAIALLLASILMLGLGMAVLARGGLSSEGLTSSGWAAITIFGAAFIALQSAALVPLMLNATRPVTTDDGRSSSNVDAKPL